MDTELQMNMLYLEIDKQIEDAKEKLETITKQEHRDAFQEVIKDCIDLKKMLDEHKTATGKLKIFKRTKIKMKLVKKVLGMKRRWSELNKILEDDKNG